MLATSTQSQWLDYTITSSPSLASTPPGTMPFIQTPMASNHSIPWRSDHRIPPPFPPTLLLPRVYPRMTATLGPHSPGTWGRFGTIKSNLSSQTSWVGTVPLPPGWHSNHLPLPRPPVAVSSLQFLTSKNPDAQTTNRPARLRGC